MSIIKALLSVSIIVSVCLAYEVNISGTVTDTDSTAVAGANVSLEQGGLSTTTGADGNFTLTGTVGITNQINQSIPHKLSVRINNGILLITITEKSAVNIIIYTLPGKVVSSITKTLGIGEYSMKLPRLGAGVYMYQIQSGSEKLLVKNYSMSGMSGGISAFTHGIPSPASARSPMGFDIINDALVVTKDGYLNTSVKVTNSDISGIEIELIASAGTVTDADGNVYQTVKYGTQVWTVENLRTTTYNDGTPVTLDTSTLTWENVIAAKYCFFNNTTIPDSIKKWGALYNWFVVEPDNPKKIAPTGWRVPSAEDWDILKEFLIDNGYNWDGTIMLNKVAKSMAAKTDWASSDTAGAPGNDMSSNNSSGFSALPCGFRNYYGKFVLRGECVYWWTSTGIGSSTADHRYLDYDDASLNMSFNDGRTGFPLRLVKDSATVICN